MTSYRLQQGVFARWIIVHPEHDHLAWSGSTWVPHSGGVGTVAQISNFATRQSADDTAQQQVRRMTTGVNRISEVFGTTHVLLPVVHPVGRHEALAAVRVAHGLGVKGVFLVDQGMHERGVVKLVSELRELYPTLWIGVNLLTRSPAEALEIMLAAGGRIDGLWSDNAGVDERREAQPEAEAFVAARRAAGWQGLYFGGVAFKYQREVAPEVLGRAATASVPYVDVVCTSGPGTGSPAAVSKIRALREGLGNHAMAIASGITPGNVQCYTPFAQAFLVGTGIEHQLGVLNPGKIVALQRAIDAEALR